MYDFRTLALGLLQYESRHGAFPPAYLADANGKPMHSWRVLILPYVEESQLYSEYRFSEPWDGPNNRKLALRRPDVFACPGHDHLPPDATTYVAVTGPRTLFDPNFKATSTNIPDGTSGTLLLVEGSRAVPWMSPEDVGYDEMLRALTARDAGIDELGGHRHRGEYQEWTWGRSVAFADSHVRFLRHGMPRESAEKLLRRDDGAPPEAFDEYSGVIATRDHPEAYVRTIALILFALLPLPWVFFAPPAAGEPKPAGNEEKG
jgi:hypothetical protein